jgi:hypothetical protein
VQIKAVSELSDAQVRRTYGQMTQYELAINELNDTSSENQRSNEVFEYIPVLNKTIIENLCLNEVGLEPRIVMNLTTPPVITIYIQIKAKPLLRR